MRRLSGAAPGGTTHKPGRTRRGEPPKQAEDRKKPNPSACTGLAEHLLPRRHGLIQSFPNINSGGLHDRRRT